MFSKSFYFVLVLVVLSTSLTGSEEELFARRIIEFWKDQDDRLIKRQIPEFMENYPESAFNDHFYAILGDVFLKEKNYSQALETYKKVKDHETLKKIKNNVLYCLYQLKDFASLQQAVQAPVAQETPSALELFYFAEALFRQGLVKDSPDNLTFLKEARVSYEKLVDSSYHYQAEAAIADILRLTGEPVLALKHYEDLLQAFDASVSLNLREHILMQWMQLLLQLNLSNTLIDKIDFCLSQANENSFSSVHYLIAKAYLQNNNHLLAYDHLKHSLNASLVKEKNFHKQALILLLQVAQHLDSNEVFEQTFVTLSKMPITEQEKGYIFFLKGLKEKKKGENEKALICFESALDNSSSCIQPFAERCQYECIITLYDEKMWQRCVQHSLNFLHSFPKSSYRDSIILSFCNACFQLFAHPTTSQEISKNLHEKIQILRQRSEKATDEEQGLLLLVHAKMLLTIGYKNQACELLQEFIINYPQHSQKHLAHIFLAHDGFNEKKEGDFIIFHANKALEMDCPLQEKIFLQQILFQTYLELANNTDKKNVYLDKAAELLYEIFSYDSEQLSSENHLWLAEFYYKKVENILKSQIFPPKDHTIWLDAKKSEQLFEIWQEKNAWQELAGYHLSMLYFWREQNDKCLASLHKLLEFTKGDNAHLLCKSRLALADVYLKTGQKTSAKPLFEQLSHQEASDPFIAYAAQLKLARIQFEMLDNTQKHENSHEILAIFKTLKNLQVKKHLLNEPIHLEAGLDYAFYRASLETPSEQPRRLLILLERVKEDFSAETNIHSKDYHLLRSQHPEKDLLYQAYMRLIQGHIFLAQSRIAEYEGNHAEAKHKKNAAQALFATLRQGKYAANSYIIEKALAGIEQ